MTIALAVLLAAALLAGYVKDTRHTHAIDRLLTLHTQDRASTNQAHDEQIALLLELTKPAATPDITELVALVDRVCQRLQAPEQAVVEHAQAQPLPPMPQAIAPDDDEGYWEAQQLPKEQLAEALMAEELDG